MTVLSKMKKGTGSLTYFDTNKYLKRLRLKQKYLSKVNKKASNKNIP